MLLDLNTLLAPGSGVTITNATGITDGGLIAATGVLANGQIDAFLLSPELTSATPEPGTLALIGGALAVLILRWNRSRVSGGLC